MYVSDYAFGTSGGTTKSRTDCLNINTYNWNNNTDCRDNTWLFTNKWTAFMTFDSQIKDFTSLYGYGMVFLNGLDTTSEIYPTAYLSSEAKITSGTGTKSDPYQLGI